MSTDSNILYNIFIEKKDLKTLKRMLRHSHLPFILLTGVAELYIYVRLNHRLIEQQKEIDILREEITEE